MKKIVAPGVLGLVDLTTSEPLMKDFLRLMRCLWRVHRQFASGTVQGTEPPELANIRFNWPIPRPRPAR